MSYHGQQQQFPLLDSLHQMYTDHLSLYGSKTVDETCHSMQLNGTSSVQAFLFTFDYTFLL